MRLNRFGAGFLMSAAFLLVFSCTIIQDSDIKSPDDFAKLKLKSFHITQDLNDGSFTTDATVALDASGRISTINWPSLGAHKLKFRTPITGAAVSTLTYNASGYLATFDTQVNSVSVESYSFEYDGNGNLTKLISTGSFGTTTDVFTYTSGALSQIVRNGSNVSTINLDSFGSLETWTYSGQTYKLQHGNCNTNISFICSSYTKNNSQSNGRIDLTNNVLFTVPQSFTIVDYRVYSQQSGNQDPLRFLDTYYIHPLMLTNSYFKNNKALLTSYLVDWWSAGVTTSGTTNYTKNEMVTINFVYAN